MNKYNCYFIIFKHKKYGNNIPYGITELLETFRTYRMALVQTPGQLRFAYLAIIAAIKKLRSENNTQSSSSLPSTSSFQNEQQIDENEYSSSDDDDDDDDDDDFKDEESENSPSSKPSVRQIKRPDTAKRVKRVKLNDKNRVKMLREQQLKHSNYNNKSKPSSDLGNFVLSIPETAKPSNTNNAKVATTIKKSDYSDVDDEVNYEDEDSEEEQTTAFLSNRDVQTVRVNQERKPIAAQEQKATAAEAQNDDPNVRQRITSDKNKRIADLVNSIKEKQKKHEESHRFLDDLKPILVGGSIFIGGIILHQLYRNFFK
jgi:hypothetical protein